MKGSEETSADMLQVVEGNHVALAAIVTSYNNQITIMRSNDDLEARMKAVGEICVAAEAAASAFSKVSEAARNALSYAMHETGSPGLYLAHHHVTTRAGSRLVRITDAAALAAAHPDLMLPQPDKPDTAAIGALLRAGRAVAGASLSNGGASVLSFRKNNQKG